MYFSYHRELYYAQNKQIITYSRNTRMMKKFINSSRWDLFALACVEFNMILVSWPVYATTPKTQSVLLSEQPLSRKFWWLKEH